MRVTSAVSYYVLSIALVFIPGLLLLLYWIFIEDEWIIGLLTAPVAFILGACGFIAGHVPICYSVAICREKVVFTKLFFGRKVQLCVGNHFSFLVLKADFLSEANFVLNALCGVERGIKIQLAESRSIMVLRDDMVSGYECIAMLMAKLQQLKRGTVQEELTGKTAEEKTDR